MSHAETTPTPTAAGAAATAAAAAASPASLPLPDFVHIAWKDDAARDTWKPRFAAIQRAWSEVEWRSVIAGVRRCALTIVRPDEWIALAARLSPHGLVAFPLQLHTATGSYSNRGNGPQRGEPLAIRVVIGNLDHALQMKKAWVPTDDRAIGELLGFPACCRDFFQDVWNRGAAVDTTWEMAENAVARGEAHHQNEGGLSLIEVDGPPEANILLRWIWLRAVPHLPCSPRCAATAELGRRLIAVGREAGFGEEMDRLEEVLGWPMSWTATGPVATVTTPVLGFAVNTNPQAGLRTVRRAAGG